MRKTNLLYIFADQWRYQALGNNRCSCAGDQAVTPRMDHFAAESMCFDHAYSTFPLCSPHRASLMTGKYPFNADMWTNCKTGLAEKIMLKPQETCIGNVLKEAGYQTGYIGKWHLDAAEQNFNPDPPSGAKDWDAYTPPGERRQGFDYWLSYGACDDHLDPHYWADGPSQIKPGKWSAEYETDMALRFMAERKDDEAPFALFLSWNPPHLPYELVPEQYFSQFKDLDISWRPNVPKAMCTEPLLTQTRQYLAAVAGIDAQFGRIDDYLKANGLAENTLVVLSADHGDMLGSQGLMSKNVWYEESIHIPLMMRQKGRISPGRNDAVFASPDHMPTVLGLLDLSVPVTCQGYDHSRGILNPQQAGETDAPADMFLCSYPGGSEMVAAFSRQGLAHKAYGWRGVKTKTGTYVVNNGYAPGEACQELLYDDLADPYQMNPREIPPECSDLEIRWFRSRLKHYLTLTGDPFLMK